MTVVVDEEIHSQSLSRGEDNDDLRCILLFCCLQILTLFQMQKTHTELMHQQPVAPAAVAAVVVRAVVVQVHPDSVRPAQVPVTLTAVPVQVPAPHLTAVTRNQVRSCPQCVRVPAAIRCQRHNHMIATIMFPSPSRTRLASMQSEQSLPHNQSFYFPNPAKENSNH